MTQETSPHDACHSCLLSSICGGDRPRAGRGRHGAGGRRRLLPLSLDVCAHLTNSDLVTRVRHVRIPDTITQIQRVNT